jgi:hypothetical protein
MINSPVNTLFDRPLIATEGLFSRFYLEYLAENYTKNHIESMWRNTNLRKRGYIPKGASFCPSVAWNCMKSLNHIIS